MGQKCGKNAINTAKHGCFLCVSKPGRQAAMRKPKNIDSVQLVG